MEGSIRSVFNRISFVSITLATVILVFLYTHSQRPCQITSHVPPPSRLPRSSCDVNGRAVVSPEKWSKKLLSSKESRSKIASLRKTFGILRELGFLNNSSKVLCVSAGAGHEVAVLLEMGVSDVTGVEVLDIPPLVSRADPHNLPYFDEAFDLGFSAHIAESLFPRRFATEMERTVGRRGAIVLAVDGWWSDGELMAIRRLYKRSHFVASKNMSLFMGSQTTLIVMRKFKL